MKDLLSLFDDKPVDRLRLLSFNFQQFCFFWNSEKGKAMFFGNPRSLKPLFFVPFMLTAEFYSF